VVTMTTQQSALCIPTDQFVLVIHCPSGAGLIKKKKIGKKTRGKGKKKGGGRAKLTTFVLYFINNVIVRAHVIK